MHPVGVINYSYQRPCSIDRNSWRNCFSLPQHAQTFAQIEHKSVLSWRPATPPTTQLSGNNAWQQLVAGLNLSAACNTLPEPGDDTMRFHRAAMSCVCGVVTTAHFPEHREHRFCVHAWHTHHYFNYFSMDVVFKRIGLLLFYRITLCMAFQSGVFFFSNRKCNKRSCFMYETRLLN